MKKQYYLSPRIRVTELDPEGLFCSSIKVNPPVKDWDNVNEALEEDDRSMWIVS